MSERYRAVWNVRVGDKMFAPGQEITADLTDEQVKQFKKDGAIKKYVEGDDDPSAAGKPTPDNADAAQRAEADKVKADTDAANAVKAGTGSPNPDAPQGEGAGTQVIDETKATKTTRR